MTVGSLDAVVDALRAGLPVVIPTDTLYGIAVSPLHAPSPGILYKIKGRPSDKPVAWLVGSFDDLETYGDDVPASARRLASAFWPGALTLIVKAGPKVPPAYRSAEGTIGLRMPDDAVARAIIGEVGESKAGRGSKVYVRNAFGGRRVLDMLVGEQLPRIC